MNMKKIIPFLLAMFVLTSCSSVMLTGRKQLLLVSDGELREMSFASYKELKDSVPLSTNANNTAMVKRVGQKIAKAVEDFMIANGMDEEVAGYEWEYNLFKVNQANAFAMPGGKIAVYEGILPLTQDENGLAVVMGHEVAHVIAKHSAERVSHQMAAQYGGAILGAVVGGKSAATQNVVGAVYGIGMQAGVLLPFSRKQELEADELGLYFMAMAGYDPRAAIPFWERMASGGGAQVPEFLSTHPSDQKRVERLTQAVPIALQFYNTGMIPSIK